MPYADLNQSTDAVNTAFNRFFAEKDKQKKREQEDKMFQAEMKQKGLIQTPEGEFEEADWVKQNRQKEGLLNDLNIKKSGYDVSPDGGGLIESPYALDMKALDKRAKEGEIKYKDALAQRALRPDVPKAPSRGAFKLSGEDKKRFDNIEMGSLAIKEMKDALDKGESTFSLIGDNNFTFARSRWEEAIGRMQSGGAINDEEAKRFRKLVPDALDSKLMQQKKLETMGAELERRKKTLGMDASDLSTDNSPLEGVDQTPQGLIEEPAQGLMPQDPNTPRKGDSVDGYIFLGGDPSKPQNWKEGK